MYTADPFMSIHHTILTTSRSQGIGDGLTYESDEQLPIGTPVSIPLRDACVEGIVIDIPKNLRADFAVKTIEAKIDDTPLLWLHQIETARWMAHYYMCSLRQAVGCFLPGKRWSELLPGEIEGYQLEIGTKLKMENGELKMPRGKKQKALVEFLLHNGWRSTQELRSETGVQFSTIRTLLKNGMLEKVMHKEKLSIINYQLSIQRPTLTPDQQHAYDEIRKETRPSLLFGVTGSGKTEVYAQLIADCIEESKQAIYLVPEILLTEHFIHRFEELLGSKDHIAIIHSRLTKAQRPYTWKRIHQGKVALVIGSRSALFAPCKDLGLVIIDEEHEWTYKNEQAPRYNTRDVAERLCSFAGAKLVLGSATPSLESWYRTHQPETRNPSTGLRTGQKPETNLYHLTTLQNRYQNAQLPQVRVIDLAQANCGKYYTFSPPLLDAIEDRLEKNEQSILFLNRRGAASALLCMDCRRRVISPDSQLPYTVHHRGTTAYLLDHTTQRMVDVPASCPHCQSVNLREVGAGTQKIESMIDTLFPSARILRADKDTLTHPEHMRLLLKKMREGSADILIGTQTVVKGLDIENVTLAAVLVADVGLSLPHFRAGERTFHILTQLTGRSGRRKPGEVIVQTFRPECHEVQMAARHQTEAYLNQELRLRQNAEYPPATSMIRLLFTGPRAKSRAESMVHDLKAQQTGHHISLSPTLFSGGKQWHILIRGDDPRSLLDCLDLSGVRVDIDPIECI